jgi:hypothetical protein
MIVADVMTPNVISVSPDSTVEDAARLMLERHVSGLFVVDKAGALAGVVTEGDMLRRNEIGTGGRERAWLMRMLVSPARQAEEFTRSHGRHVRDVMTPDVIAVAHDAPLEDVVRTMETKRIKRLPVTRDGHVVGVVSRSDLMRALIAHARGTAPVAGDDTSLRQTILAALKAQSWAPATTVNVTVNKGVADIWGSVTNEAERHAIRVVVENTPGIGAVHDHLVFIEPYTGTVIEQPEVDT